MREASGGSADLEVSRTVANAGTQTRGFTGPHPLEDLVREGLNVLRKGESTEYVFDGPAQDLLDVLVIDPSGGDEDAQNWPENAHRRWADDDEQIADYVWDFPIINRWATVRAQDLVGRLIGILAPNHQSTVVVVDPGDGRIESGRDLAVYSWFSEADGAPVSWGGTSRLANLSHGWLLYERSGDEENFVEIWRPKEINIEQTTNAVKRLLRDEEAYVAAAIALEPFDLDHTLLKEDLDRWGALLEEVTISLRLESDAEVLDMLRADLPDESDLYRATRQALREPAGVLGQRFLADLTYAVEHDMPMPLSRGAWIAPK